MDIAVKIFQSLFYIIASTVAILTYLKAKDGLLNSVNTEYQKKVMEINRKIKIWGAVIYVLLTAQIFYIN